MTPAEELRQRVARLARRRWWLGMLGGALVALAVFAAVALALIGADHSLDLPPALRLMGLLLLVALGALAVVWWLLRPALIGARIEAAARVIERQSGIRDNRVINACQFARRGLGHEAAACADAIAAEGARVVDELDVAAFLGLRRCVNGAFALALLVLAWGAYAASFPHHLRHAADRLLYPLRPSGELGAAAIAIAPRGEVRRYLGGAVSVDARVTRLDGGEGMIDPQVVVGEVGGAPDLGERLPMALHEHGFRGVARDLRRDRVLRVAALGARSAPLRVRIVPRPVVTGLDFALTPPAYIGGGPRELPAGDLDLIPGSTLRVRATASGLHDGLVLVAGEREIALQRAGQGWSGELVVEGSGRWQLRARVPEALRDPAAEDSLVLASGGLRIAPDRAPEVRIDVVERNTFLAPGARLELPVVASDDHGLRMVGVTAADSVDEAEFTRLAVWPYLGPPGRPDTVRERLVVDLDPRFFEPGRSYVIRAIARDFLPPSGQLARSEPVVVRVLQPQQLATAGDAGVRQAFAALQAALQAQDRARGRTAQVRANRPPPGAALDAAASALAEAQDAANAALAAAHEALAASAGGAAYASVVDRLRRGDAALASAAIAALPGRGPLALDDALGLLRRHQDEVYVQLVALLGRAGDDRAGDREAPDDTKRLAEELADHLRDLARQQRRLAERGAGLSGRERDLALEALIAERGREQDRLLLLLELRADDLASLPERAVTVPPAGHGWDAVRAAMRRAGDALFALDPAAALPHQQAAAGLAERLVAALEAWIAELPGDDRWQAGGGDRDEGEELESVVGALLAELEDLGPAPGAEAAEAAAALDPDAVDAATGHTVDPALAAGLPTLDDGPGLEAPARDTLDPAAAPPPPELRERMQRLAQQQAGIRQQATDIAQELRRRGYPSGDLEAAVAALKRVAEAASRGDAVELHRAHSAAIDALGRANRQVATETRVRRERAAVAPGRRRLDIEAVRDQIPHGYETMVERYFQALQGRDLP